MNKDDESAEFTHNVKVNNSNFDKNDAKNAKYNNFTLDQEREDEQPISTMKQDENKCDKIPTPKCDIELPEKIAYPSEKAVGQNENFSSSQKEVIKPKKRSTIRETAVNEMKSFEIFKKFEDDDNIKNDKLSRLLDDYRVQAILMVFTIYALFGDDYRLITAGMTQDASYDAFTI